MRENKKDKTVATVERERERESYSLFNMVLFTKLQSNNLKNNILSNKLYVETLSFINQTKKHIKIDKDRLYAKICNEFCKIACPFCVQKILKLKCSYIK